MEDRGGRVHHLIHLFVYNCLNCRVSGVMFCFHFIVLCVYRDDITVVLLFVFEGLVDSQVMPHFSWKFCLLLLYDTRINLYDQFYDKLQEKKLGSNVQLSVVLMVEMSSAFLKN